MAKVLFERLDENRDKFVVGAKAVPEIIMDFSSITPEERNQESMGSRILCVAALSCYCNTMVNAFKRNDVEVKSLTGSAAASKEKDEVNRTRYTELEIHIEVGLDEKDRDVFETVKDNMLNGSLLTYSLEEGMEVDYNIEMKAV
ncbi:osmotically inducible protein OsmC [Pseudodesulfovibrio sp. JC047]|uniref:OsmC family protein n=1 Tax=Pseudodesulfovibrio sp. JC047 TaxID=2683199 RepID=UPI0013D5E47C|nr:OsmC family protein [Pseudodesulfovibrio sp. JC047]NDV18334.1 osmotically inducible protein OsmC [Pseudodesulfovibrio sp. JC047]